MCKFDSEIFFKWLLWYITMQQVTMVRFLSGMMSVSCFLASLMRATGGNSENHGVNTENLLAESKVSLTSAMIQQMDDEGWEFVGDDTDKPDEIILPPSNDDIVPQPSPVLRFFLLGDWGKGGNTGKYYSALPGGADDDLFTAGSAKMLQLNDSFEETEQSNDNIVVTAGDNKNNNNNNNKMLYQPQVARAMANLAANSTPAPSFVLALGDNFYVNGVANAYDVLWNYLWTDVYLRYPSLCIPWYAVLGNHDYGGGESYSNAQVQRSQLQIDKGLWNMPAKNYSKIFPLYNASQEPSTLSSSSWHTLRKRSGKNKQANPPSVAVLFVDTTTLAPSINKCCNENAGVSQATQQERIRNQLQHLEAHLIELTASEPTWIIAVGHYPIFSDSSSGNVTELITYLLPLLIRYRVHAYICGHDHLSEHLYREDINMHFFVAGAGSMTDKISKRSAAKLLWAGAGYAAFAYMDATPETLTIHYVDTFDVERYNFTLTNPRPRIASPIENDDLAEDDDSKHNPPLSEGEREKYEKELDDEARKLTIAVAVAAVSTGLLLVGLVTGLWYVFRWEPEQVKKKKQEQLTMQTVGTGSDAQDPKDLLNSGNGTRTWWSSYYFSTTTNGPTEGSIGKRSSRRTEAEALEEACESNSSNDDEDDDDDEEYNDSDSSNDDQEADTVVQYAGEPRRGATALQTKDTRQMQMNRIRGKRGFYHRKQSPQYVAIPSLSHVEPQQKFPPNAQYLHSSSTLRRSDSTDSSFSAASSSSSYESSLNDGSSALSSSQSPQSLRSKQMTSLHRSLSKSSGTTVVGTNRSIELEHKAHSPAFPQTFGRSTNIANLQSHSAHGKHLDQQPLTSMTLTPSPLPQPKHQSSKPDTQAKQQNQEPSRESRSQQDKIVPEAMGTSVASPVRPTSHPSPSPVLTRSPLSERNSQRQSQHPHQPQHQSQPQHQHQSQPQHQPQHFHQPSILSSFSFSTLSSTFTSTSTLTSIMRPEPRATVLTSAGGIGPLIEEADEDASHSTVFASLGYSSASALSSASASSSLHTYSRSSSDGSSVMNESIVPVSSASHSRPESPRMWIQAAGIMGSGARQNSIPEPVFLPVHSPGFQFSNPTETNTRDTSSIHSPHRRVKSSLL